jgi:hypothetical protein
MNLAGLLRFLFILAYFVFDFFFLFLQIALRDRLSIVADVEGEELVSCWRDVVRIRVLASDSSIFVQYIGRDPVRESVLAEQGFEILLMLSDAGHERIGIREGIAGLLSWLALSIAFCAEQQGNKHGQGSGRSD